MLHNSILQHSEKRQNLGAEKYINVFQAWKVTELLDTAAGFYDHAFGASNNSR